MEEMSKHGKVGLAAMKAGMDRKTARKYVAAGTLPSEVTVPRDWRTREDPFAEHWPEVEALVRETPALEAKTLFELLSTKYPDRYEAGQLRTLQRRVRLWRATQGPDRAVTFAQQHRPGEAAQTDFTSTSELGITVAGQLFVHLLASSCCRSPTGSGRLSACRSRWRLCARACSVPCSSSVACRAITRPTTPRRRHTAFPDGKKVFFEDGKRPFNDDYLALMRHFGMTPRTTAIGAKEQNGDVESENGAIKRRLEQLLLVRGSRDFEDVEAWQSFIDDAVVFQISIAADCSWNRGTFRATRVGRSVQRPRWNDRSLPVLAKNAFATRFRGESRTRARRRRRKRTHPYGRLRPTGRGRRSAVSS